MTPTAKEWLDSLKRRRDGCLDRLEQTPVTDVDRARRNLDMAYADLYGIVIAEAERLLPKIEHESFFAGAVEPWPTLREKLLHEEWTA